jgi:hypothetical protein
VSKSVDGGSSGEDDDDDWDSASVTGSLALTSRTRSRSVSVCTSVSVIVGGTGRGCGTMGSEGGGERGRCGCDVRGLWVSGEEGEEGIRVEETEEVDVPATCDGESSHSTGSGTVCFGSESVGGGDG